MLKRIVLPSILIALSFGCHKEQQTAPLPAEATGTTNYLRSGLPTEMAGSPFTIYVGEELPADTSRKWKTNFASLVKKPVYANLHQADISKLLAQPDCVGIEFYCALDGAGQWLVLPYGVTSAGVLIVNATVPTVLGPITKEVARKWRAAYVEAYPNAIRGHFMGALILKKLESRGCQKVRATRVLDDSQQYQIILSDEAEGSDPTYEEDRNRPCPIYCPTETN